MTALDSPFLVHGGVLGTQDPCILNVSGGRTSGLMLYRILEAYGGTLPAAVRPVFTNTGREFDETLDFVQEMGARWDVSITWLERDPDEECGYREVSHNSASRNGEPFERLIEDRRYLPNRVARFCTVELKIRPTIAWARGQGYTKFASVLGYRADERHRLLRAQARDATGKDSRGVGYTLAPLVDAGVTRRDVAAFWARQPFDLRLPNINGKTPLGNCDGCFLKGAKTLAGICRQHPGRFDWWVEMERRIVEQTGASTGKTFRGTDRMSHTQIQQLTRDQGDLLDDLPDDAAGIDCYCTGE